MHTSVTTPDQHIYLSLNKNNINILWTFLKDLSILIVILVNKVLSGNAIKNILRTSNNNPFYIASQQYSFFLTFGSFSLIGVDFCYVYRYLGKVYTFKMQSLCILVNPFKLLTIKNILKCNYMC